MRDAGIILSEHAANVTFDQLSLPAVERTKYALIDTLAAIFAGNNSPGINELVKIVQSWGGKQESSLFSAKGMYPLPNAVFVNAAMGRAMDIDDYHAATGDHPSVSAVTAALSTSEHVGGISGISLITSIAVAEDIVLRIRKATRMGPWTTGTYAPFSSAIAAGKIMGLSKQQLANAFGLAFTECSSTRQPHREGVLAIRIHQGLSVKAGVVSALLAKEGITGPLESLEGEFGLYNVFFGGNYDRKTIYKGLGSSFEIENVSIKPYPCCAMTHRSIEAALQIRSENNLSPDEIDKIIVYVNTDSLVTVGQPLEQKQTPKSIIDAQFSIPYTVACALVYNKVDMSMFTVDAIRDEKVINISKKIEVKSDPVYDAALDTVSSTQFLLYTKDNRGYSKDINHVKGSPENPMKLNELKEKYLSCIDYGLTHYDESVALELFEYLCNLEKEKNINNLFKLINSVGE